MPVLTEDVAAGVRQLTIDNPDKKNALSVGMLAQLARGLETAARSPEVRVVLLTASGDFFSAGGDTERMGDQRPSPWEKRNYLAEGVGRVARSFAALDKPTVAAINGPAIGAGVDLALWCDFRIAHVDAYLRLGFVDLGLVPGFGSAWTLSRLLGPSRAMEIMLLGEPLTAAAAKTLGLVRSVSADPLSEARQLADLLAAKPSPAVRATKRLVQRAHAMDVVDSLDMAWAYFGLLQETPEHTAAVETMRQRRKASRTAAT